MHQSRRERKLLNAVMLTLVMGGLFVVPWYLGILCLLGFITISLCLTRRLL